MRAEGALSKMRAAPPSSPVVGAEPLSSPAAGAEPLSSPAAGTEPLSWPAVGAEPLSSPAAGAEPLSSPAVGAEPLSSPAAGAEPLSSPAAGAEPLSSPAAGAEPLSSPVVSTTPLSSPVERPPGPCAAAAGDSMLIHRHRHNSAAIQRCFISGPLCCSGRQLLFPGRGGLPGKMGRGPFQVKGRHARTARRCAGIYSVTSQYTIKQKIFPLPILRKKQACTARRAFAQKSMYRH